MSGKKMATRKRRGRRRRRRPDEDRGVRRTTAPGAGAAGLLGLQQRVGNRAVQRLLASPTTREAAGADRHVVAQASSEQEQAAVRVPSGPAWAVEFPVSASLRDLSVTFGAQVRRFVEALAAAGAVVEVLSTRWSPEAAYLMHWAWRIAKESFDPRRVPEMSGIRITWWHGDIYASQDAARAMVEAYGIEDLKAAPPVDSPHVRGDGVDMSVAWDGVIPIQDAGGIEHVITSDAMDGVNEELLAVAETYGLFYGNNFHETWLHYSVDGR